MLSISTVNTRYLMRSTLFIGNQKLDQEDMTISFDNLPAVITGLGNNKLIPEHIEKNILLLELENNYQGSNLNYHFSEFHLIEKLIDQLLEKDLEDCKIGLIIKCCGHTLSCVFERKEDDLGNIEIRLFNVDSVAYEFDGADELKEDFKQLMDKYKGTCKLFSTDFLGGGQQTKRQHQEGICATYALIDTIMMLTVPKITEHMMQEENHHSSTDLPTNIRSIQFLPPHLMLLTQSITGQSSGSYSIMQYCSPGSEPTEQDKNLLFGLFSRSLTPRSFMDNLDANNNNAQSLKGFIASDYIFEDTSDLKRAILSALGFDISTMEDDSDLANIIPLLKLCDEEFKSIIMITINKILHTTLMQELLHDVPTHDLKSTLDLKYDTSSDRKDDIWRLAERYFNNHLYEDEENVNITPNDGIYPFSIFEEKGFIPIQREDETTHQQSISNANKKTR